MLSYLKMLSNCTKECLTRCNCCNRITRFRLPNRRFSHEWTRQEIQWEVGRRSPLLIAFRLIVRGILLLQSVLDRNAYLRTLATKVLLFYSLASTIYFFFLKRERFVRAMHYMNLHSRLFIKFLSREFIYDF